MEVCPFSNHDILWQTPVARAGWEPGHTGEPGCDTRQPPFRDAARNGAAKSQPPKGIGRETSAGIPRWTLEGDWRMTSSVCYD